MAPLPVYFLARAHFTRMYDFLLPSLRTTRWRHWFCGPGGLTTWTVVGWTSVMVIGTPGSVPVTPEFDPKSSSWFASRSPVQAREPSLGTVGFEGAGSAGVFVFTAFGSVCPGDRGGGTGALAVFAAPSAGLVWEPGS